VDVNGVRYRLSDADRAIIALAQREVFLAIVLANGDLLIKMADPIRYVGHIEWAMQDRPHSSTGVP
jgi:hypothetical protein